MKEHRDMKDWKDGYCAVINVGNYEDGQLYFPDLNIQMNNWKCGVTFFKSFKLLHGVLPFIGNRLSVVLFTPNSILKKYSVFI